jgi:hypothetical protein
MSIILSLVGNRISDDCLTRSGYREVVRISGKDLVRVFGTRICTGEGIADDGSSYKQTSILQERGKDNIGINVGRAGDKRIASLHVRRQQDAPFIAVDTAQCDLHIGVSSRIGRVPSAPSAVADQGFRDASVR